jgi:hypothetical protein
MLPNEFLEQFLTAFSEQLQTEFSEKLQTKFPCTLFFPEKNSRSERWLQLGGGAAGFWSPELCMELAARTWLWRSSSLKPAA